MGVKIRAISPIAMGVKLPWWWKLEDMLINIIDWIIVYIFRRGKNVVRIKSLGINEYADKDYLVFEVVFQLLVDYVEGELAWMNRITVGTARMRYHWSEIPNAREHGLTMLEWEVQQGDDSPTQSEAAQEIRELYLWYKDVRPARYDYWEDVPDRDWTTEPCPDRPGFKRMIIPHDEEYDVAVEKAWKFDQEYKEEDTEMLCRVIKIRQALWT